MMLLLGKHQFIVSSIDECGICDPRSSSSSGVNSLPVGSSKSRQSPSKRIAGSPFVSFVFKYFSIILPVWIFSFVSDTKFIL